MYIYYIFSGPINQLFLFVQSIIITIISFIGIKKQTTIFFTKKIQV